MSKVIAAIGDSLFNSHNLGVLPHEFAPGVLQASLRAAGFNVTVRNFGRSGWGTGQILNTLSSTFKWEVPSAAVILLGSNDQDPMAVVASPAPTTTSCSVTAGKGVLMPAGTRITINGVPVTVLTQTTDALTFAAMASAPTTGQAVVIDTVTNLTLIGQGLLAAGVRKLMMVGKPYQNLTNNADTVSTENATMAALRTMQRAAATALGCPYVDMYAVQRQRILDGIDVQGSASTHVYQNNTHHNAYGGKIIGETVAAAVLAEPSWTSIAAGVLAVPN